MAGVELTAGAVAHRLGVSPSTLRSWARRYGLGPVDHQPGRYRRYSERDVAELQVMCRLVGQGVAPASAAARAREHPTEPRVGTGAEHDAGRRLGARAVRGVVGASRRLDSEAVVAAVTQHLTQHGVVATWQRLCRPALAALDREVLETGGCIHAQLVAVWAISTALRPISVAGGAGSVARASVLVACTDGEQHTLATEALHAALAEFGLPVRMLGPSVPDSALVEACRRTRPDTVVLWAQTRTTARPDALTEVAQVTPSAGSVLALGPGWSGLDLLDLPDVVDTADDLPGALRCVARRFDGHAAPR